MSTPWTSRRSPDRCGDSKPQTNQVGLQLAPYETLKCSTVLVITSNVAFSSACAESGRAERTVGAGASRGIPASLHCTEQGTP